MLRPTIVHLVAACAATLFATACPPPLVCAPNGSHACACPDGHSGSQTCNAEGTGFVTACSCDGTSGDGGTTHGPPGDLPPDLDLLLVIDNSNSMRENQANLMAQFEPMLTALAAPPCTSAQNAQPHGCDPANPDDRPLFRAVRTLHAGVVSTDLGTPGSSVPGCANSTAGDDGLLNPIRNGVALRMHEPFSAPTGFRPPDCTSPDQFPSFIAFDSSRASDATYVSGFAHDLRCNAGLYYGGCGLEQPLDAAWRALIGHDASDAPGNTDPNAGFVRRDALLAIVVLTDEEDGSVRDCRYAHGAPCDDATNVYDPTSTRWASTNLNLRFYMYRPGTAQDPTWPLERYVDPADATHGFPGLKPGHPERVVFVAITGVPLNVPRTSSGGTDWDALLGAPGGRGADDFAARNSATAVDTTSAEGPISMRQANLDPACPERVVPACRREGSTNSAGCTTTEQYFAWPARRVVEVARRFDQSALCGGGPCGNGAVASICAANFGPNVARLVATIGARL